MRAAVIDRYGGTPSVGEVEEPLRGTGEALIAVAAAPLNPVDLHIASGTFYAGAPQLPYVPGREGVGTVIEGDSLPQGRRIRFLARSGYGGAGSLAERAVVSEATAMEVVDGVDDVVAAGLGIPALAGWLALEQRAGLQPGEHVLVLAATGVLGQVAVQAARLLGAGRTVAAGRHPAGLERSRELGADATIELRDGEEPEALAERLRAAAGDRLDVVVDPVWGRPAEAAAIAASPHARIVNVGAAATDQAVMRSALVRGKSLSILGLTVFALPAEVLAAAYRTVLEHAAAGRLVADIERLPLAGVAEAWERLRSSAHVKLVIDPRA